MGRLMLLLLMWVALAVPVGAQDSDGTEPSGTPATDDVATTDDETDDAAEDEAEPIIVRVRVEDAWVRLAPSREAERIGSIFLDDPLEIVGRNYNGLWYEVRRPFREESLGWIFNSVVSDVAVQIEFLPLTDGTTSVEGENPVEDTGVAVFTLAELTMRAEPNLRAEPVDQRIPQSTTAQVIYRNQDATWLFVNYNGVEAWIAGFLVRERDDLLEVPVAPGLPPLPDLEGIVVPPEIQLEQVERLRAYVIASRDLAAQLTAFWEQVEDGGVMPCEPPPFVNEYPYSEADVRQLPELGRLVPRVDDATGFLNNSLRPLTQCGVFDRAAVVRAKNGAINAEIIFENSLLNLDSVQTIIESQIDK